MHVTTENDAALCPSNRSIPDGGGHRTIGRRVGRKTRSGAGYSYIHTAVDDHSPFAYSEILGDEKKETATALWTRA